MRASQLSHDMLVLFNPSPPVVPLSISEVIIWQSWPFWTLVRDLEKTVGDEAGIFEESILFCPVN